VSTTETSVQTMNGKAKGISRMNSKVVDTAVAAVADIGSGATLAVGGFGLCGVPDALIAAITAGGATDFAVFSNNCGVDDYGLGILLSAGRIARVTASYVFVMLCSLPVSLSRAVTLRMPLASMSKVTSTCA
jgi:acyl CoA:acetate/3-ketoacid CoA transferase alpha subunit